MLCFWPKYDQQAVTNLQEIIILIDCSASMCGSQLDTAKQGALHLLQFLANPNINATFNVASFGTTTSPLFKSPQSSTHDAIQEAVLFVNGLKANQGGSQIKRAITTVTPTQKEDCDRSIVLFTVSRNTLYSIKTTIGWRSLQQK
jgi:uncharacterized protein with von Willebrand factor type A (vWA) domain